MLGAGLDAAQSLLRSLAQQVDESMQSLAEARASLRDVARSASDVHAAEKHINDASETLTKMSTLARSAISSNLAIGSPLHAPGTTPTLSEVIAHAAESATELASRHGVRLHISVAPAAAQQPAGPLYTVAMHAIQNAIEAIATGPGAAGDVYIELRPDSPPPSPPPPRGGAQDLFTRPWFVLDVRDTGDGPPTHVPHATLFEPGFSTKPGHDGLGLALAKSILAGMGGTLELLPASVAIGESSVGGCVIRARFPSISPLDTSGSIASERRG
jgi:signal transduction histidine kinase